MFIFDLFYVIIYKYTLYICMYVCMYAYMHVFFSFVLLEDIQMQTLHFVPLTHALLGILSILHSSSLVAHYYSYNLPFQATLETLVEGFMWPFIVTIGNLKLDLCFFFPFSFRLALLGALSFLRLHTQAFSRTSCPLRPI